MNKVLISLLVFCCFSSKAQDDFFPFNDSLVSNPTKKSSLLKPLVSAGSAFSLSDKNSSIFTQSVSPNLSFPATKKINLTVGTQVSYSQIKGLKPNRMSATTQNANLISNSYSVVGDYIVNQNFKIIGGINYSLNQLTFNQEGKPIKFDDKEMHLGFEYKIRDNVRVYGEFGVSNGLNPMQRSRYSPFMSNSIFD